MGEAAKLDCPLVTVCILNYHRLDALTRVLDSIRAQEYPALETVVVDNGSGGETTAWIRRQYPWVRLVALPENIGTAARNAGIAAASGDILVMLDNDVHLDDSSSIDHVLDAFERHREAGCIAFRVYHPETGRMHARDWCHPRPWQQAEGEEFETYYITEGACAFRREVFQRIEPYWEKLWIGHEGLDLGLWLIDAGYEIWYAPAVKVWHMASLETRESWHPYYFNARNLFLVMCRGWTESVTWCPVWPCWRSTGFARVSCGLLSKPFATGWRSFPASAAASAPGRSQGLKKNSRHEISASRMAAAVFAPLATSGVLDLSPEH